MKSKQKGFTLMEMIGVIAVIAILASMATPMIFEAIRNARISTQAEDINVLRAAVAQYFSDTGQFPTHNPASTAAGGRRLMADHTTSPISGWNGPYIEQELENRIGTSDNIQLLTQTSANYQFDLDGDGTVDTAGVSVLRIDNVSDSVAEKMSEIMDGDIDGTGTGAWNAAGRVKRFGSNSDHAHILLVYISRI